MCGFAALFCRNKSFDNALLDKINSDLYHRGPDSGGVINNIGFSFVFRRLAILDVGQNADQPMLDSSGRFILVFNGEIYNYKELRSQLSKENVQFRTTGDTEVILNGFIHWGESILDKLEGMFSFVIWDKQTGTGIAARDPLGIKPLYMCKHGDLISFSSEMRPLRRLIGSEPDENAIAELLIFRFASGRLSNIKGIDLIPGGTLIKFSFDQDGYSERPFFDVLNTLSPNQKMSKLDAVDLIEEVLKSSVRDHLQSDVGYTVQLSGGVDSSLIAALCKENSSKPLKSYGVNLGNIPQNEESFRKIVIDQLNLEHMEVYCSDIDFADAFSKTVFYMEGPTPHFGCVMLLLLCEKISQTDKVVLTGEGADELFGGYARYGQWRELNLHGKVAKIVPQFLWPFIKRYQSLQRYAEHDPAIMSSVYFNFLRMYDLFPDLIPKSGYRETVAQRFDDFRDRMMAVDQTTYLSSLLMRQDKAAMAASVEARVPFVHLPVFKAINSIPREIRIPGKVTKPLLKLFAEKWFDKEFLYRRKVGLNLPLEKWLSNENGFGRFLSFLTDSNSCLSNYTSKKKLRTIVDSFRKGERENLPPVPHLINMELWLRSLSSFQ